jgi:hypothetical protein
MGRKNRCQTNPFAIFRAAAPLCNPTDVAIAIENRLVVCDVAPAGCEKPPNAVVDVETISALGEDHFSVLSLLGNETADLHKRVLSWMRQSI